MNLFFFPTNIAVYIYYIIIYIYISCINPPQVSPEFADGELEYYSLNLTAWIPCVILEEERLFAVGTKILDFFRFQPVFSARFIPDMGSLKKQRYPKDTFLVHGVHTNS